MTQAGTEDVILDTSVLINFLAVDRADLLGQHPRYRFLLTVHVRKEVTYPDQAARLEHALLAGELTELLPGVHAELATFANLTVTLGLGESAAIAAAAHRTMMVGVEDRAAQRAAERLIGATRILTTTKIMVSLIQCGLLTIAEADSIKNDWEANHSFTIPQFKTFGEVVPPPPVD